MKDQVAYQVNNKRDNKVICRSLKTSEYVSFDRNEEVYIFNKDNIKRYLGL